MDVSFDAAILQTSALLAGMPSPELVITELGKRRAEEFSFFVAVFLLCAALVQWLWNSALEDVAWAPRLTYAKSLGVVALWGLAMVVVLSLVSGARELMTPTAWEPNGVTHRLAHGNEDDEGERRERRGRIDRVRFGLWDFAAKHDGRLPTAEEWSQAAALLRTGDEHGAVEYRYEPSVVFGNTGSVLVYEPQLFDDQFVLFGDGTIALRELPKRSAAKSSTEARSP